MGPTGGTRRRRRGCHICRVVATILGYVAVAAVVAALVIGRVDGYYVSLSFEQRSMTRLSQSEVTTLVSLGSTLVRAVGAYCCGIASWHVAFMMLEKSGMTLSEFSAMGTSSPFIRPWPWRTVRITIIIISLVFISSGAYSAILNGSVTWKPAISYATNPQTVNNISLSDLTLWQHHSAFPDQREGIVNRALGHITKSVDNGRNTIAGSQTELWRVVDSASGIPVNSTLSNVTLPFFVIDSLEWVEDPAGTLDSTTLEATNFGSSLLNYTSPNNPMQQEAVGILALIPHTRWSNSSNQAPAPPRPSVVSAGDYYYVALKVAWIGIGPEDSCESQDNLWSSFFPPNTRYYRSRYALYPTDHCIAFARVSFRAGAGICKNCRVISNSVIRNDSQLELQPDLMTSETIFVMSEVSVNLARMNVTLLSPAEGIDRYVIDALTQSYAGSWTALSDYFGRNSEGLSTSVQVSMQVLRARVDHVRVIIWFLLHVSVAVVCAIAVCMQFMRCRRRILLDGTLSAVLLDATGVVNHFAGWGRGEKADSDCVCDTSALIDDEVDLVVKMDVEDAATGSHKHYQMVPKS